MNAEQKSRVLDAAAKWADRIIGGGKPLSWDEVNALLRRLEKAMEASDDR